MICLVLRCLLDGIYLTAGLTSPINHATAEGAWCMGHWCHGPLGYVRIGTAVPLSNNVTLDLGLEHVSYVLEDDRGREQVSVSFTWRPFKGR